jgi:hypothetical protein
MSVETKGHVRLRVTPGIILLRIMDDRGRLQDFYNRGGSILPEWADHDQKQVLHFMRLGMVELCDDAAVPTDPGRVIECLSALICAGVPLGAGRPRAAEMLRADNGLHYSNETVSKAIKLFNSEWKFGLPIEDFL